MIIYKPFIIDATWCSILLQQMWQSNYCSNGYNMCLICLFKNPDEPVKIISPTIKMCVLCWNHHHVFSSLRTYYAVLSFIPPPRNGWWFFACRQGLPKLEDLIRWSPAEVYYRRRRNSFLEGDIEVIHFTLRILDPDGRSLRHNCLVGIGIFYLAIKSQTLNRSSVVKWLMVIQQPILEFNKWNVKKYNLIISEHESTNFVSPVHFNLHEE